MEGRLPPDDDDLFEWTDAPARSSGDEGTGETELPGTAEEDRIEPDPGERRPSKETGERRRLRLPAGRRPQTRSDTAERRRIARGDTGEFERSGRRPPPGRRARRRDLPASVRRRQDAIVGIIALIAVILLVVAVTSGGGGGSNEPTVALKRLVGQTIVAKLGKKGADQDLLKRIRKGRVGALIAFPRNAGALSTDVRQAQSAAKQGGN